MKLKFLFAPVVMGFVSLQAYAEVNPDCQQNIYLMQTYSKQAAKTGNYSEAVAPFEAAYSTCPDAHRSIYTYGANIVRWQMNQATDVAAKTQYFDKLMKLFDDRMKYFSTSKTPTHYIRGLKAVDYVNYVEKTSHKATDPQKKEAYKMLKQTLDEGGANNELAFFQYYYLLSRSMFESNKANSANREQYVNDYLYLTNLLSERVSFGNEADSTYDQFKGAVDLDFGRSGAADCNQLNSVYASQVDSHKDDKAWLQNVLKLYDMADCDGSTVYFKASEYLYKIEPTYTAANGLAAMAYSKKDINGAIGYLNKACDLATSRSDKSNIMLKIAGMYFKQKNFSQTRAYAQKALSYNSNNGNAYLYIGMAYAQSYTSISSDPFVQRTAFWAAVDKLEKAKAVDSNCAANANKLINSYKAMFPDKKEGFMRKVSGSYTVPGWINEKTTARYK